MGSPMLPPLCRLERSCFFVLWLVKDLCHGTCPWRSSCPTHQWTDTERVPSSVASTEGIPFITGLSVNSNQTILRLSYERKIIGYYLHQLLWSRGPPATRFVIILRTGTRRFVMHESNAIVRYLASKYAAELYPADFQKRGKIDEVIEHLRSTIEPACGSTLFPGSGLIKRGDRTPQVFGLCLGLCLKIKNQAGPGATNLL